MICRVVVQHSLAYPFTSLKPRCQDWCRISVLRHQHTGALLQISRVHTLEYILSAIAAVDSVSGQKISYLIFNSHFFFSEIPLTCFAKETKA